MTACSISSGDLKWWGPRSSWGGRGMLEEGSKVMVRWFLTFEARDLYSCDWSYPVAIQINIAEVKWQISIVCSRKLGDFSSLTKCYVDDNDIIYHGCLAHHVSLDCFSSFYILCPTNHTGLIQMPRWDIISPDEKPWNARSWRRVGPGWVYQLVKLVKLVRALSQYSKVAGSIALQGTYKNPQMNA